MISLENITARLTLCQQCSEEITEVKYAYVLTLTDMSNDEDSLKTYQFSLDTNPVKRVVAVMFHKECWNEIAGKRYSFDLSNIERFSTYKKK